MSWPALLASSEPCAECETVLRAGAPVLLVRGALIRPRYHSYAQRLLPLCLACARPHWPAVERDLDAEARRLAGTVEELAGRAADTLTTAAELTAHDQRLRTVLDLARGGEGALLTAEADDAESRLPELTWHRAALAYHVTGCLTTARRAGRQLGRELPEERASFETFEIAHDPKPTPR